MHVKGVQLTGTEFVKRVCDTDSCSFFKVESSPYTSSPTSARDMVDRISAQGCVIVSLRRSTTGRPILPEPRLCAGMDKSNTIVEEYGLHRPNNRVTRGRML